MSSKNSSRSWQIVAAAVCSSLTIPISWLCLSYFTGNLIGPESRSSAYDSLGQNLLQAEVNVDPETINWEGFDINGKKYIYFGPFPALLRIVLNYIAPQHFGNWARVSCLMATTLFIFASTLLVVRIAGSKFSSRGRGFIFVVSLIAGSAFAFASPVAFLLSSGRIYHEALLWGLCGAQWSILFIVLLLEETSKPNAALFGLSCAAAVALLSRVTLGLPAYGSLLILLIAVLLQGRRSSCYVAILSILPAAAALLFQGWYNLERFGGVYRFIDYRFFYLHPEEIGGEFNIMRAPSILYNYLVPSALNITSTFPYIRMVVARYSDSQLFFDWREHVLALPLSAAWLLGLILLSIVRVRHWLGYKNGMILIVWMLGLFPIFSIYFVTQRYIAEIVPALTLISCLGMTSQKEISLGLRYSILILIILSLFASGSSALHWQIYYASGGIDIPGEYQRSLRKIFMPRISEPIYGENSVYLDSIVPISSFYDRVPSQVGKQADMASFEYLGNNYDRGIGMHANSNLTFAVPENMEYLEAIVGVPDNRLNCSKMSFRLEILNERAETLWKSDTFVAEGAMPEVTKGSVITTVPTRVLVDLQSSESVTLAVDGLADNSDCDYANWVEARFIRKAIQQGGGD